MSRCSFPNFFLDPFAKRCDESIEDRRADGILPQLGVEEVFTFDIVRD